MELSDLEPAAVLQAFKLNNLTLEDLVGRLDEISRTAEKPTKDGGSIEDGATRLAATKELLEILQVKQTLKKAAALPAKKVPAAPALVNAMQRVIEAEVVPRTDLPS